MSGSMSGILSTAVSGDVAGDAAASARGVGRKSSAENSPASKTDASTGQEAGMESRISGYRFSVGELHFLDNSNSLLEVLDVPEVTPVAGTAAWFAGLATVKSEMLPVTDFSAWLALPAQAGDKENNAARSDRSDIAHSNRRAERRLLVVQQSDGPPADFANNPAYHSASSGMPAHETKTGEQIGVIVDQVIGYTEALATPGRHLASQSGALASTQTLSPSDWLGKLLSGATPIRNLSPGCEQRIASLVSRVLDEVLIVGEQTLLICDLSRLLTIPSMRDIRSDASKQALSGAGATA